jgi:hypothetical protein
MADYPLSGIYEGSGNILAGEFSSGHVFPSGGMQSGAIGSGAYNQTETLHIWSGMLASGSSHLYSGGLFSGLIQSGYSSSWQSKCCNCETSLGGVIWNAVTVLSVSGNVSETYCWKCAGFNFPEGFIPERIKRIRESVPFQPGTALYMIADWLQENGRQEEASFINSLMYE